MMLQVFDRPESHSELPVDSNEPMIVHTVHNVNISLCEVQTAECSCEHRFPLIPDQGGGSAISRVHNSQVGG